MKTFTVNFFKGMLIGVANIIPGVSGGTIAVVLGIFDMLIDAINNFYKDFKRYFIMLAPIGLGAVVSIGALSNLISFSLENYTFPTVLFFTGLVVGSVPVIYNKAAQKRFNPVYLIATAAAFAVVMLMTYVKVNESPSADTDNPLFLMLKMFISGVIAAAAMVIPGISGSFVLILLGMYNKIIHTISVFTSALVSLNKDELIGSAILLLPVGVGIVLGILLVSKIISVLLENFYSVTYYAILGLVAGSIFGLLMDLFATSDIITLPFVIAGALTFCVGVLLSVNLSKE